MKVGLEGSVCVLGGEFFKNSAGFGGERDYVHHVIATARCMFDV